MRIDTKGNITFWENKIKRKYLSVSKKSAIDFTRLFMRAPIIKNSYPDIADMLWTPYFEEACRCMEKCNEIYQGISLPQIEINGTLYRNYNAGCSYGDDLLSLIDVRECLMNHK